MIPAALAATGLLVGCGSSSSQNTPKPGTYRGTTSQNEPLTLTVAADGKSLSDLRLQAKYTCPAGSTAVDGVPRSPGGSVPLSHSSFAGGFTAQGTTYRLAGSYNAGTFTGTLSGSLPALGGTGTCSSGNAITEPVSYVVTYAGKSHKVTVAPAS